MKILIITAVGGFLQKFLMQDVRMLQNRGDFVYYASNFDNPIYDFDRMEIESMGVKCYNIPIAKSPISVWQNAKALKELNEIIKTEQIDAVYLHNPMGGVLGRMLKGGKKLATVYTAHGFHFYKGGPLFNWLFYYTVERILARKTDVIVTINHEDEEHAKDFHLKKNGFVERIPGVGVDTDRFYPDKDQKIKLRDKYGISESDFVFLSVGELNENKNHATIIEAFKRADLNNALLLICGEGPDHEKLSNMIIEDGLEDKVRLYGYCTDIEEYDRIADVFVFPSIREGLGMAALEAMTCGLPLVVADSRGTREYAKDNAIICEAHDVKAFAEAFKCLYEDKDKIETMSKRSVDISKDFTLEKAGQVMEHVFARLEEMYGQ